MRFPSKKTRQKLKSFILAIPFGNVILRVLEAVNCELAAVPAIARCVSARIFSRRETLLVGGWIRTKRGKVLPNNWGDDINISFFAESTGRRVLSYPNTRLTRFLALRNFVLIGSVISFAPQKNSVIWGSGLINDKIGARLQCVPEKILAVRGPLTREWLLAQGVDCPAVFGDPALLLPRFYTPKKLPRARVGLIPHHADIESGNAVVKRLAAQDGVRLVRVQGYANWRDFIDEICASDFVISASLHGLIVAEAYKIPALWVEFSEHIPGWDFKFRDFYASVGKTDVAPVKVCAETTLDELLGLRSAWRAGNVETDALLAACPLELCAVNGDRMSQIGGGKSYDLAFNTVVFPRPRKLAEAVSSTGFFVSENRASA